MPGITGQTSYGKIVAAKLRQKLVTRSLANNNYQGDARTAVAVMIPVTPEFSVGDYSKTSIGSNAVGYDSNSWINSAINNDKFINNYIDNYELATLPYDEKANALDRAAYALAKAEDSFAVATLKYAVAGNGKGGSAYPEGDPRYQKSGQIIAAGSDIYDSIVDMYARQTAAGVPTDGRWLLTTPTGLAKILSSNKAIRQSDLSQEIVAKGAIAMIGGYEVYTTGQLTGTATATGAASATNILAIAGHPDYFTAVEAFRVEPNFFDGNGDSNVVGGVFLKGRMVYTHEVTDPRALVELVEAVAWVTIAPEAQTTTVFGKLVSAIQSADTRIENGILFGTLPYVSNWTGYSPSGDAMASGNYVALKATIENEDATKITCELTNGNKGELELDADLNAVFRIADKNSQSIVFRAYDSENTLLETKVISLWGLDLGTATE